MKGFATSWRRAGLIALLLAPLMADATPQPPMHFEPGTQGTHQADWQGVAGRTYFLQFSLDLETWQYAPIIEFGAEAHSLGINSDSDTFFLRLIYSDFAGITSLAEATEADFDQDRLPNLFEVTFGYDPLAAQSSSLGFDGLLDPDGDGFDNIGEAIAGTNPFLMDSDGDGFGDNLEVLHGGDLAAYLATGSSGDAFEVFTETE